MQDSRKVVAVTGACGFIGTRLMLQLEFNEAVARIVAFDRDPLPYPIHNIACYRQDFLGETAQAMAPLLTQNRVDTLVHLAGFSHDFIDYQGGPGKGEADIRILEFVLRGCEAAGIRHVILVSSNAVYGAFPDNPIPLTENSPVRARPEDVAGQAAIDLDAAMLEFQGRCLEGGAPGPKVTILRTCPVLGFMEDRPRAARVFPQRFSNTGENPPLQFLHEDDLANLLEEVIFQEAEGLFNVAGEGVVFLQELAEMTQRKWGRWPGALAPLAVKLANQRNLSSTLYWNFHTNRYPSLISNGKIKQALKFRFRHTSIEAVQAFINYNNL